MIKNHEPIWFTNEPRNTEQAGYSLFVATPVHSEVSIHYAQALLELQKHCFCKMGPRIVSSLAATYFCEPSCNLVLLLHLNNFYAEKIK